MIKDSLHNHSLDKCPSPLCNWTKHIKVQKVKIKIDNKKKIKRMIRDAQMLEMYLWHKMTLEQIGKVKKVTREWVRQILSKYPCYFEEKERRRRECREKFLSNIYRLFDCGYCKKPFNIYISSSNRNLKKRFCSWECRLKARYGENYISIRKDNCNRRANEYYHQILKKKPNWQEIIRQRNLRQHEKTHPTTN